MDPARIKAWKLDAVIPGTAYLAGLQALRVNQRDEAAKWLRAAARLGYSDSKLESLLAALTAHDDKDNRTVARLEQAIEAAGPKTALVARLAREYRLHGRANDAHRLLDRADDANAVLLGERGLLHLGDGHLVLAERAFAKSVAHDPADGATLWNLLFTRLSMGRLPDALQLLPAAVQHAPNAQLKRLGELLNLLFVDPNRPIENWTPSDDESISQFLMKIGRLDTVECIFDAWAKCRSDSVVVQKLKAELLPLRVKQLLDQGDAIAVLRQFGPAAKLGRPVLRNLLGIAAALRQDFAGAARHFQAALANDGTDAGLEQNLAIVYGWNGDEELARRHWLRFLGLQTSQLPKPGGIRDYNRRIEELVRSKYFEHDRITA
jgi:Flp pilus assembly protein TadD